MKETTFDIIGDREIKIDKDYLVKKYGLEAVSKITTHILNGKEGLSEIEKREVILAPICPICGMKIVGLLEPAEIDYQRELVVKCCRECKTYGKGLFKALYMVNSVGEYKRVYITLQKVETKPLMFETSLPKINNYDHKHVMDMCFDDGRAIVTIFTDDSFDLFEENFNCVYEKITKGESIAKEFYEEMKHYYPEVIMEKYF